MTASSASSRAALAAVAIAFAAMGLSVASPGALAFGLVAQLLFAAPGVLIMRRIAGVQAGWLAPMTLGPLVGQALGSAALTGLWAAGGRGPWVIVAAPAIVALLVRPAGRLQGRWRLPTLASGDRIALLLLLLVVPLIVALPFANVGAAVPDGQAYRAYFTADYVWERAVVAELAKGDFLPVNPYFANDALHYYWMPHLLSAAEYRAVGSRVSLDELLLMRSIFIDAFFVACLYGFVRMFVARPWAAASGVATVTLCSSYEGAYALWSYYQDGIPLGQVRYLNIDALSRWFFQGMPIDGMQRLLLYQPHHQVGYAMGLLGLVAVARRARRYDPAALGVAGLLLGLSTLISSFAGLMFTVAVGLFEGASVIRRLEWRRALAHGTAGAVPLAMAAGLVLLFQYVDPAGSVLQVGLNPVAAHRFAWVTFLSLGPVLILGGAGAMAAAQDNRRDVLFIGALSLTCVGFYFFVDVRDHQNVYVGWRVGHLLFMGATVLFALLFEQIATIERPRRNSMIALVSIVLLGAVPTTAIDIYNTQDITNRGDAPSFKWTMVLTPEDRQLFEWLQHNTAPDALVQVDPRTRDTATWAYLPAFAERRMAVGLPISMVPLEKYQQGSDRMSAIYEMDARAAYDAAIQNHIDYLIVGAPERQAHPGAEGRFDSIPVLMPLVLRNATISVYKVVPEI
ncbi:MAG: hypothetical protein ABI665_20840 [Vicinamibacterales bacterium]